MDRMVDFLNYSKTVWNDGKSFSDEFFFLKTRIKRPYQRSYMFDFDVIIGNRTQSAKLAFRGGG